MSEEQDGGNIENNLDKESNENKNKSDKSESGKYQQYVIGSKFFLFVLIFLATIYAVDIVLEVFGVHKSLYTEKILETVNTLAFTICGYLFGRSKED